MKTKYPFFLIITFLLSNASLAQVNVGNLGFNYSALVRDTAGRVQPLKAVKLRFTLLLGQNGTSSNSPWIETQNTSTDAYGFVNVSIGAGTKAGGTANAFSDVDFSLANYWIMIEVLNTFTSAYDPLAKQALQAVPYAKVAGAIIGSQIVPPGIIIAFGGDASHIPEGWILCDGRELDNTNPKYIPLFNAIGYGWGTSNHANLFNVPYTSGLFLRGANNGTSNDPEAGTRQPIQQGANGGDNVGSYQTDMLASHTHTIGNPAGIGNIVSSATNFFNEPVGRSGTFQTYATGGLETRPKNVYVNYIIKL